ncbi:DNA-dependent ATPase mgs1 [Elasticomyces elasticus]|nr:DNA-dependent ATPase mgs1 [Elasticomyces elasticus]KAK4996259.1 DNA-dependent ATPase mgs1 [Elasticomyces elasticus]
MVDCPICGKLVKEVNINRHIDSDCKLYIDDPSSPADLLPAGTQLPKPSQVASFFHTPAAKRSFSSQAVNGNNNAIPSSPLPNGSAVRSTQSQATSLKRSFKDEEDESHGPDRLSRIKTEEVEAEAETQAPVPATKRTKPNLFDKVAPLAERMRPRTLDEVHGQELVGPNGVIRNLIEQDRVPSLILWGGPGTGKTSLARLIARTADARFVEINSTSSGVAECKKLFAEARNELGLTGRKTIIFCDEIHRFSKSQQDVFLGPVEAGQVTLIGATTENPSFKIVNALLSRCRTFTLSKLTDDTIVHILKRAFAIEAPKFTEGTSILEKDDYELLRYLAAFADGDARTALNLLELALDLCQRPDMTAEEIKKALTQTLVYDRAGDQHYDTISAFHKSIRGSDPDAALYYLARMLQSGEDPLYIARRMVVIASEDIGLADNTMLPLATAAHSAAEKIGMPECRINLGHCAVALALAKKSTRAYRGLNAAYSALGEPGIAGLPVPVHLRNAPTRLMKEMGYGKEYKYNPDYLNGQVVQEYLPEKMAGRRFLEERDLGTEVDSDVLSKEEEEERLLNPDGE